MSLVRYFFSFICISLFREVFILFIVLFVWLLVYVFRCIVLMYLCGVLLSLFLYGVSYFVSSLFLLYFL